jgi:probable rRNA maturation factor
MAVALVSRVRNGAAGARKLRSTAGRLLETLGYPKASLSLSLVGDAAMRRLNREYRRVDRTTDVLSFPLFEPDELKRRKDVLLGDVVISIPTARRQAAAYGAPLQRELERLLIHGVLHLLGHDHEEEAERTRMIRQERRLARAIGMPWPY